MSRTLAPASEPGAAPPAAAGAGDAPEKPSGTLEFDFRHRVFSAKGAVFRMTPDRNEVTFCVPLGSMMAALSLDTIRSSFEILPDSVDDYLLKQVCQALKFVQQIRPGDSIPSEILDGRASWMVDEKYLLTAKARISMQLVGWISGKEIHASEMHELLVEAEKPETRRMVQEAFGAIAEKLGYKPEQRSEVVDLVDRISQELSYVEALRDRFGTVRRMGAILKNLAATCSRDRNLQQAIARCTSLLAKPAQKIMDTFGQVDANTGEILQTLRNYEAQVDYIRKVRDELRETYLLWEELLQLWDRYDGMPGPAVEKLVRETYRFAARHFSQAVDWSPSA